MNILDTPPPLAYASCHGDYAELEERFVQRVGNTMPDFWARFGYVTVLPWKRNCVVAVLGNNNRDFVIPVIEFSPDTETEAALNLVTNLLSMVK